MSILTPTEDRNPDLGGRVSKLEAQLTGLAEDVDNVLSMVQAQSQNIAKLQDATSSSLQRTSSELAEGIRRQGVDLSQSIQALAAKHDAAQRPQWATYASWAAVLLAFGGIFGSIVMGAIGEDRVAIQGLESRDVASERERATLTEHSRWVEKFIDKQRSR